MKVTVEKNNNVCIVTVEGDVDTLTAPELDREVSNAVPACKKLVLDMGGVDYISSAGIRSIVKARQQMGGDNFALKKVSPPVLSVLKLTGFLKIINVEE